jgi:hypothetical protein
MKHYTSVTAIFILFLQGLFAQRNDVNLTGSGSTVAEARLNDNGIDYRPYRSSQDTSVTLYANFIRPFHPGPILVSMHGWHGAVQRYHPDDVKPALSGEWFLIQPEMRGRGNSGGKQDANGWELQDVVDAVEFAKKHYHAFISDTSCIYLTGGSGGGGNVLGLIGKFPDYFCSAICEVGISDYGLWYRHDMKGEFRDEMETQGWIGGTPDSNPEAYSSRGGITTLENLLTPLAMVYPEKDIRVPVEHAHNYLKKADAIGKRELIDYLELKGVGAVKGGGHWENITVELETLRQDFVSRHLKKDYKPVEIPRQGRFIVAGYLKTKHFEIVLDKIDNIAEVIYDLDKGEFKISPDSAALVKLTIKRTSGKKNQ